MSVFKFKHFTVNQDKCAMKVGTDGVLLGAWTSMERNPYSVLDIGTGTGVIALMLAQRSKAETIDALEIEENAYEQCVENFENSQWNDRLFCYHASLQEFALEIDDTYDLIVSNPPFYTTENKSKITQRDLARFEDAMPFSHLVACTAKLLSEDGSFCVIIPYNELEKFTQLAKDQNLYPSKILNVKGNPKSSFKRSLLEFTFQEANPIVKELTIEIERHHYTPEYIALTKDFYIKM